MNDPITAGSVEGDAPPRASRDFVVDLALYLTVMFSVRLVHVPGLGFLANGLVWSGVAFGVATWRMNVRGFSWRDLGLGRPKSIARLALVTMMILAMVPAAIVTFELVKDRLPFELAPDLSNESAPSRFGDLRGNWSLFASTIVLVWTESMLEELLDRGFLITWLEGAFSKVSFATVLAVLLQAAIFGYRHSYDLSSRSITVGLIALVMGIGYVAFGRNLWPLIVAHGVLNTMSMMDRVV